MWLGKHRDLLLKTRAGERLPFGYGVAYTKWEYDVDVLYPIGLNVLVRWARAFYWWLIRNTSGPDWFSRQMWRAYHEGETHGYALGWNQAFRRMDEHIAILAAQSDSTGPQYYTEGAPKTQCTTRP